MAQSVVLRPGDILPTLQSTKNPERYYINGRNIIGLQEKVWEEKRVSYGPLSHLLLSITALRIADEGKFDLDSPLYRLLGDYVEDIAFQVPVTPKHLIVGTSGYAVPSWYRAQTDPMELSLAGGLKPYLITARHPGQTFYDDPAGRTLLAELIEEASGLELTQAIQSYVLDPLGLKDERVEIRRSTAGSGLILIQDIYGSLKVANAVLISLMSFDHSGFLTRDDKMRITHNHQWQMHPLAAGRTLGLSRIMSKRYHGVTTGYPCTSGLNFILLPDADIAFIDPAYSGNCHDTFTDEIMAIIKTNVPPKSRINGLETTPRVREIESPNGFYIRESMPTAALKDRLDRLYREVFTLVPTSTGFRMQKGDMVEEFKRTSPYAFENDAGEPLFFSTDPKGGYFTYKGETYRFIGLLGDMRFVLAPFPWSLVILFTAAIYIFVGHTKTWRRMGKIATLGTTLVAIGLYLDINFWHHVIYELDAAYLVTMWRIMLNGGLALILSVPLYALYFSRHGKMPAGIWTFIAPIHLTLLTASALILFLLTIAWGIGAEFAPY